MKNRLLAFTLFLTGTSMLAADDWPQWRGPEGSGMSKEKGLLKSWPNKKGPKLDWTYKNAGLGFSAPVIVGDSIYVLGTRDEEEVLVSLNLKDGAEQWTAKIGPIFTFEGNVWGDGPRGSATVDGDLVYALGGQGDLICVNRQKKGEEVWR